jgi:hypothetical protein
MYLGGDSVAKRVEELAASPHVISAQAKEGPPGDDEITAIVAPVRSFQGGHV